MISQEYLKLAFDYNKYTGILTRLSNGHKIQSTNSEGYIQVYIKGKAYPAHRVIWLYLYGEWPKNQIDHINGIRNDNRVENLRDVVQSKNMQNSKHHRSGGLLGTSWNKRDKKWISTLIFNRQRYYLGYYNTGLEAHNAYMAKLAKLNNGVIQCN